MGRGGAEERERGRSLERPPKRCKRRPTSGGMKKNNIEEDNEERNVSREKWAAERNLGM